MNPIGRHLATLGLEPWRGPTVLTADEARALCLTAPHEGLVALLGAAVDHEVVRVDPAAAAVVAAAWGERMEWCVRLDTVLLSVVGHLAAAGIDTRVLKGVAVAALDEPDPGWRSYGDVDVLVPDHRFLDAVDALATAGWRPAIPPVSRRWLGEFAKGITLVDGSGAQVDLHRLLATGVLGERVRMAALFADGQAFTVAGVTLTALAPVHRFLHACYHASLGGVTGARHMRDVLLLAHKVSPSQVEARLEARTAARREEGWSRAVVHDALTKAGTWGTLPEAWGAWLGASAIDPDEREMVARRHGTFGDKAGRHVRELPGLGAKVRYLAPLLWPASAHLAARGSSRITHLRRTVLGRAFANQGSRRGR